MGVADFLWQIALRKGIVAGVKALLATYGANLAGAGITIDQQAFVAFLVGLLEALRNWLKQKKGIKWL